MRMLWAPPLYSLVESFPTLGSSSTERTVVNFVTSSKDSCVRTSGHLLTYGHSSGQGNPFRTLRKHEIRPHKNCIILCSTWHPFWIVQTRWRCYDPAVQKVVAKITKSTSQAASDRTGIWLRSYTSLWTQLSRLRHHDILNQQAFRLSPAWLLILALYFRKIW